MVAAGGISTAQGLAAALSTGADAARIGTLLLATPEAEVHPAYRAAVLAASGEDTTLTEAFSASWPLAPHRVLGSCINASHATGADVVGSRSTGDRRVGVSRCSPIAPDSSTTGETVAMPFYAGQGVGDVVRSRPAADVVLDLVAAHQHLHG